MFNRGKASVCTFSTLSFGLWMSPPYACSVLTCIVSTSLDGYTLSLWFLQRSVCLCVCVCTASYQASFEPGSQGTVPTGTLEAHKQNLRRACLSKITWSEDESMFASYHELDAVRH